MLGSCYNSFINARLSTITLSLWQRIVFFQKVYDLIPIEFAVIFINLSDLFFKLVFVSLRKTAHDNNFFKFALLFCLA